MTVKKKMHSTNIITTSEHYFSFLSLSLPLSLSLLFFFSLRKCLQGTYFGGWLGCFPGCPPGRFVARAAQAADSGFVGYLLLLLRAQKTSHSHVFLVHKGGAGLLTTNNERRASEIKGLERERGKGYYLIPWSSVPFSGQWQLCTGPAPGSWWENL